MARWFVFGKEWKRILEEETGVHGPAVHQSLTQYAEKLKVSQALADFLSRAPGQILQSPHGILDRARTVLTTGLNQDIADALHTVRQAKPEDIVPLVMPLDNAIKQAACFKRPPEFPQGDFLGALGQRAGWIKARTAQRRALLVLVEAQSKELDRARPEKTRRAAQTVLQISELYDGLVTALSGNRWKTAKGLVVIENLLNSDAWKILAAEQRLQILTAPTQGCRTVLEDLWKCSPKNRKRSLFEEALGLIPGLRGKAVDTVLATASPQMKKDLEQYKPASLLNSLNQLKQNGTSQNGDPGSSGQAVVGDSHSPSFYDPPFTNEDLNTFLANQAFASPHDGPGHTSGRSGGAEPGCSNGAHSAGHGSGAEPGCSGGGGDGGGADSGCGGGGGCGGDLRAFLSSAGVADNTGPLEASTWQAVTARSLIGRIMSIPDISRTAGVWSQLDREQRQAFLQSVADCAAAACGMPDIAVQIFNEEPSGNGIRRGYVDRERSIIWLNMHPLAKLDNF
ncbi:MAG: hypothetical protein M3O22_06200, partial [Pseudomonadota bacterium]|nr:hypothetical protein [Pseudomonadota bacterium]